MVSSNPSGNNHDRPRHRRSCRLPCFSRDRRYETTKRFFDSVNDQPKAVTIFTLLELCGIFACANRTKDAQTLFDAFIAAEDVSILFPELRTPDAGEFWSTLTSECFGRIQRGMRLGDAAILWALETNESAGVFVTWNTKYFQEKTPLKILTPSEFLASA
jgi:hypothetical protein